MNKKYPNFSDIYNQYLKSNYFRKLFNSIKRKYDNEYQTLFFRHSFNFLNFYLKENDPIDTNAKKKTRKLKLKNPFNTNNLNSLNNLQNKNNNISDNN